MHASTHVRAIAVDAPYRLDLTVAVLRRTAGNVVDLAADGGWLHAFEGERGRCTLAVRQSSPGRLELACDGASADADRAVALARRMLGTDTSLAAFDAGARDVPWLAGIAARMRGVRPPRYPTLWEAIVNAVVFQQVSLHAASAILRRTIVATGAPADDGEPRVFPPPEALLAASDATLRAAGQSAAKVATLRAAAQAIVAGELVEAQLEALPSSLVAAALVARRGIGPWTAAVILLRGLGRLDVFPERDSGVARSLQHLSATTVDVPAALERLAPQQGMLYYHALLARLEANGALPGATPPAA